MKEVTKFLGGLISLIPALRTCSHDLMSLLDLIPSLSLESISPELAPDLQSTVSSDVTCDPEVYGILTQFSDQYSSLMPLRSCDLKVHEI